MNKAFEDFRSSFKGKSVAVIGVGVSNKPLIRMLCAAGASVTAYDRNPDIDRTEWEALDVTLRLGEDYLSNISADVVFRTPGLRPDHPALEKARANGCRVTSEMREFFAICPCPIIGVTGSDGKTTTTTLIYDMLTTGGYTTHLGGNIGSPLLTLTGDMSPEDICVVELSSFQLMDMDISPDTAVITNISPNHLDWHRGMDEYIVAKRRILDYQKSGNKAVLNGDNELTAAIKGKHQTSYFSGQMISDSVILGFLPLRDIKLRGWHNVENVLAAIAAVRGLVPDEAIYEAVTVFEGVSHRDEYIATVSGVEWYNNSIGSSPTRTIATMRAHPEKLILIAGGKDKGVPFDELAQELPEHVKSLILIGAAADQIHEAALKIVNCPPVYRCVDMEDAVHTAYRIAVPNDIVLLSPACTAFDMYKNFEERGKHFIKLVKALKEKTAELLDNTAR